jgi:GxxExxY protein
MYRHADVTERVIASFYQVYNTLGYGFLEKVYHNAMGVELKARGLAATPKAQLLVYYAGEVVGEYYPDYLVEGSVILELKSAEGIAPEYHAQLLNYLKATDIDVGLILNFGPKPEIRRKVYETARHRPDRPAVLPPPLDPSSDPP